MDSESRSERHRRAKRLEAIGKKLIELSPGRLETAPLDDRLRDAVISARKMSRAALRRQTLFIGGLLRALDDEVSAIVEFVEEGGQQSREEARHHALIESWRDRLLAEGEPALRELLGLHPEADRQQLRQLLRSATKEKDHGKAPAAARKLFRLLREVLSVDPESGDETPPS